MLKGKCPRCGKVYYGYALKVPRNQFCEKCGVGLKITNGSGEVITGYSPFYARKLATSQPSETPGTQGEKEPQEAKETPVKEDIE